jgi:hypothetical protein
MSQKVHFARSESANRIANSIVVNLIGMDIAIEPSLRRGPEYHQNKLLVN